MKLHAMLLASCGLSIAAPAFAQEAPAPVADAAAADPANDDIVVTAVARSQNKLDTSVSVSALSQQAIANFAPRSVAEVFRNLPGIRSESSGGEGNANIAVRGLPVATGGAKYLQLQEDGLGVLEFGDIIFGNSDIFMRSDFNIERVEAVRGGSASTFASNAPGGVINLISKTGLVEGGAVQGTVGLDYGEYRVDGDYGGRLSDTVRFHIGGFYRRGEGPRDAGYDANRGGQVKGNITKEFPSGYLRASFKYLDDRAIAYLPSPVRVTGTDGDPTYRSIPGLDANSDALQSKFFRNVRTLDGRNRPTTDSVRDGMRPLVKAVGLEGSFDVLDGWQVTNRFRYSDTKGRFIAPIAAGADSAQAVANSIGGAGSRLFYASGPMAGQAIADPAALNGNGLAIPIVLFNVKLNSLDNVANDLRVTRSFDTGGGTLNVAAGFYKSRQDIDTEWRWTSHLIEANGGNAALLDVRNAAGTPQTEGGAVAYGASFFGNCCRRAYDVRYDTNAPFASLGFETGPVNIDGSVRYDFGRARGRVFADGPVATVDVNGNGAISVPETKTTVLALGGASPVRYDYNYWSYSFGANYRVSTDLALFGRYSRGGRTNADRILLGPAISPTGGLLDAGVGVDFVKQAEAGLKYRSGPASLFITGFHAKAEEQNFDPTTVASRQFVDRRYRSNGVELEGSYRIDGFELAGTATYTDSKITSDAITPANVGNRPKRQAKWIYQVTPQYRTELFTVGANVVGTSSSYTQDSNQLKLPGYTQVNAFVSVRPIERVQLSINANNLFDVNGFTEAEEATIPANGIVRARSINGRTISASVKFDL
ncbi:MAG: TonB-dependent receptor [Sphingomonas sp.]